MYCKLFTSIYQGTLRGRSDEILVFTNLLAHSDREGVVDKHPRAISEDVGLPLKRVNAALVALESEDSESRSPENEGRRIIRLDEHRAWGWHITNYAKYRAIRNEDDRRESNRLAQARWREKRKHSKPPSSHAEADAKAEALRKNPQAGDIFASDEWKEYEAFVIEDKPDGKKWLPKGRGFYKAMVEKHGIGIANDLLVKCVEVGNRYLIDPEKI